MKKLLFFLIILFSNFSFGQISLEQFNRDYLMTKKATIIYFYTDWCAYCKIQENEIEKNSRIKNNLNQNFYFLKINAESTKEIIFLDEKYPPIVVNNKPRTHSFAQNFVQENKDEAYPLWIILDENLNIISQYSGVLLKSQLEEVLERTSSK